jgi:serine/threonine protein kinase
MEKMERKAKSQELYKSHSNSSLKVLETTSIHKNIDESGNKTINQYIIHNELGRGISGKVKLVTDKTNQKYALKIINKNPKKRFQSKLSIYQNDNIFKINREIAILKKCRHPRVVQLIEVMDSKESDKIYLVLEYMAGGELLFQANGSNAGGKNDTLKFKDEQKNTLGLYTEDEVRAIFRDIVSGVQYRIFN